MCGGSPCLWQKTDVGAHWWLNQPFYEWLPRILGLKRHATLLTRSPPSSQPPTCHHPPDSACWLFLCLFGPGLSVAMQFVKMHHKVNNWIFELLRPRTFDSIFSFPADVKEAKQGKERRSARSPGCGPPKATPVVGRFVSEIQRCDGTNRFSLSLCLMATMMMTPIMAITWDVVPHWQVEVGEEAGVSATWPMPMLAKQFYTKIITHPPPVPTVLHWIWNLKLTRDAILKLSFPIPLHKCICFFFFINNTF